MLLFFLPEHVKARGVINFHRIRLPGENDCFSLYLVTIFQFPVVFVTLNIFANEQNRGKRRRCSTNFTLGPGVICIYIESIRFWFIIVTIRGRGRGAGGAAGRLSVTCYEALVREHPRETKAGDNYGAGTKLVLLSPFTRRFKAEEKVKQRRMPGTPLFPSSWRFSGGKHSEKMKSIYGHGAGPAVMAAPAPRVPVFALSRRAGANYIQDMRRRWSHDRGGFLFLFFGPVMEIWIIIECGLRSDVCTCYDSP